MKDLKYAVQQVEQGDSAAFQRIVDATSARFVRLSARMLGSMTDAEDVVQEAYVKAYRSVVAGEFRGRSRVETWLCRIVANTALDALRRRKRYPDGDGQALPAQEQWDGAAAAEARVALAELADLLEGLPGDQRIVMVLTLIEGLSSREAAEILEITEGAVEQRLVRARAWLRERTER